MRPSRRSWSYSHPPQQKKGGERRIPFCHAAHGLHPAVCSGRATWRTNRHAVALVIHATFVCERAPPSPVDAFTSSHATPLYGIIHIHPFPEQTQQVAFCASGCCND